MVLGETEGFCNGYIDVTSGRLPHSVSSDFDEFSCRSVHLILATGVSGLNEDIDIVTAEVASSTQLRERGFCDSNGSMLYCGDMLDSGFGKVAVVSVG